jgi:hypothetical protein
LKRPQGSCSTAHVPKKIALPLCLLACIISTVAITLLHTGTAAAQGLAATSRVIQGKVFAPTGEAKAGAVVYLKDEKSLEIKTYISGADGAYRFGQLGSQDDYQLWAEADGHKSKTKNISSFDSKKRFDISLHLEAK